MPLETLNLKKPDNVLAHDHDYNLKVFACEASQQSNQENEIEKSLAINTEKSETKCKSEEISSKSKNSQLIVVRKQLPDGGAILKKVPVPESVDPLVSVHNAKDSFDFLDIRSLLLRLIR